MSASVLITPDKLQLNIHSECTTQIILKIALPCGYYVIINYILLLVLRNSVEY
jgi:hypothetical protein